MEYSTGHRPIQKIEPVTMAEFTAFAGNDDYLKAWEKYQEKKSPHAGFNKWAALLGGQWFIYRKLYVQGLISFVAEFGIPVAFIVLARLLLDTDRSQQYVAPVGYCAIAIYISIKIAIGYWANIVFYKKAVSTIRKIDQLNLDNERHLNVIRSLGEPSFLSVVFLYLGIAIAIVGFEIVYQ